MLSLKNSLYILDVNYLSDVSFSGIFYQFVACLYFLDTELWKIRVFDFKVA